MKIIKPSQLSLLTRPYRAFGSEYLGVAVASAVRLDQVPVLFPEAALWKMVAEDLAPHSLDASLPKSYPEFLASAKAYGRYCDGEGVCQVSIRVGELEKTLRICGDRYWKGRQPTKPQPFESLPIDWPQAFGGKGYAENPQGRGVGPEAQDGAYLHCLPNVEYPHAAIRDPRQQAMPASFAPREASRPSRAELYGKPDETWFREDCPGLPRGMDPAYFNTASIDQQWRDVADPLTGAAYALRHLHPQRPLLSGRLPALRGRCFLRREGSGELEAVPMRLTTAWFVPHRECVILIHHGSAPIQEFDAHDVACLLIGAELAADPRPLEAYRQVYEWRVDKRYGALYALRDADLLPASLLAEDAQAVPGYPLAENALRQNQFRGMRHQVEKSRETVAGHGVDPDTVSPPASFAIDAEPEAPAPDKLVEFVKHAEQLASTRHEALKRQQELSEAKQTAALQQAAAKGHDSAAMEHKLKARPKGPPASVQEHSKRLLEKGKSRADWTELERLRENADEKLLELYRRSAQHQEAAPRLPEERARALRAQIADAHARDAPLPTDLTGADLSGMDLRGARLAGALLEQADLSGADLSGADLRDALLVRAQINATRLVGADLCGANLALARVENADFSAAQLSRCCFESTAMKDCCFAQATLEQVQFVGDCQLCKLDFSGANLSQLVFMEQTLIAAVFHRAVVRKLVFVKCHLTDTDFSEADILGFGMVESQAQGLRFVRGRLGKACFTGDQAFEAIDFSHARLSEVNLRGIRAIGARFDQAQISDCDFSEADLTAASFPFSRLERCHLTRTRLRGANFESADLFGAFLRRAQLEGVNFRLANLFRANLAQVSMDRDTCLDQAYMQRVMAYPMSKPEH